MPGRFAKLSIIHTLPIRQVAETLPQDRRALQVRSQVICPSLNLGELENGKRPSRNHHRDHNDSPRVKLDESVTHDSYW